MHTIQKILTALACLLCSFSVTKARHYHPEHYRLRHEVAFYKVKKQAKFADDLTRELVKNPENLKKFFSSFNPDHPKNYVDVSVAMIGNLAFVFLNCRNKEIKEKCERFLRRYRNLLHSYP